jgi:hypothetical protein
MKLVIMAKINTTERCILFLDSRENDITTIINEKFDGQWVIVNKIEHGDVLKFNSEEVYSGYDGRKDGNYCKGNLNPNK